MSDITPIPVCHECHQRIDLTVCWCGTEMDKHSTDPSHPATPYGCICGMHVTTHIIDEERSPGDAEVWYMGCGAQTLVKDDTDSANDGAISPFMDFIDYKEAVRLLHVIEPEALAAHHPVDCVACLSKLKPR